MNEEQGKFLEELYHANFKRMLLELYPILKDMPSAQENARYTKSIASFRKRLGLRARSRRR